MSVMQQINLSIIAGQDGGLVVYELVDGEQTLVFGGDLPAATKYLESRMSKIIVTGERPRETVSQKRPRELPISASLSRLDELDGAA